MGKDENRAGQKPPRPIEAETQKPPPPREEDPQKRGLVTAFLRPDVSKPLTNG